MFSFGFASPRNSGPAPHPSEMDGEFDEDDDASVGDEINDVLVALMPWGISIVLHVVLIVVAFYLVWMVIEPAEEEQAIIPNASLTDTPTFEQAEAKVQADDSADAPRTSVTPDNPNPPSPDVTDTEFESSLSGLDFSGGELGGGEFGNTDGNGDFGVGMFNSGGNAREIAFVVDASGSMIDVLPFVINELKKVISELKSEQKFTIIFFNGEGVFEVPGGGSRRGIRAATPDFKRQCTTWITLGEHNVASRGRGSVNAIEAIELALKYDPQLVFLLSDNLTGGGIGATTSEIFQPEVMDALREANDGNPPAKFNTIQFLYTDPLVHAGLTGTMQLIANETQGVYKFMSDEALNLR